MGTVQKGLIALGVMLLLVVLAAGNCGPDELPDDGRLTVTETTDGAADSRVRTGSGGAAAPTGPAVADDGGHSLRVRVLDDAGMPLVGARIALIPASPPGATAVATLSSGSNGRATLEDLDAGAYLLNVVAAGYLSTGPVPLKIPEDSGGEVVAQLRSAGRIDGALYGLDGVARTEGLVRLKETTTEGRVFHVQPDERGDFRSGPLEPGVWELAWIAAEGDLPDARLVLVRAISAGEHLRVEFTLPVGGGETAPGRRVGVTELRR